MDQQQLKAIGESNAPLSRVSHWLDCGFDRRGRIYTIPPMRSANCMVAAILCLLSSPTKLPAQNLAGDEALSKVLVDGEDWQLVAEGFGFTDGACSDAEGNFYFMDLGKGTTVQKITPDGKVSDFIPNAPKCSGIKFGPDGRLYACTQGPKKQ